jgi:pre-rRNA-processing protein TSR3
MKECDPKKCSGLRLGRNGFAKIITRPSHLPGGTVILDPFAVKAFSPSDRRDIERRGLTTVDCSWNELDGKLKVRLKGNHRCMPLLIAGNPINYGSMGKLSTVEAFSGALFIIGEEELADRILSKFKWGHTFLDLNKRILLEYQNAEDSTQIIQIQEKLIQEIGFKKN